MSSFVKTTGFAIVAAILIAIGIPALAQVSADPHAGASLTDLVLLAYSAGKGHQWILLGGIIASLLTRVLTAYGPRLIPFLGTDRGGVVSAAVVSLLVTVAAALAAGKVEWATLLDGIITFGLAVATYIVPKKLASSNGG